MPSVCRKLEVEFLRLPRLIASKVGTAEYRRPLERLERKDSAQRLFSVLLASLAMLFGILAISFMLCVTHYKKREQRIMKNQIQSYSF